MAVPNTTTFTFQDVSTAVYGDTNPGRNLVNAFSDAIASYRNMTYWVQIDGQNHLLMFRDYGSHNAPTFSSSVSVAWVQMGPTGQVQFTWSVNNLTSTSKTYYLRATIAGQTANSSSTLNGNQGSGGMIATSHASAPTGQVWKFYIREGNNSFTESDVKHTSTL
jgi:hypothetical protein